MAIKQISLITGSYDLDFIPGPHSAAQDDRTDFEELGATGKVQRNRPSGVTHGMDGAILPNTLSPPSKRTTRSRRKSDTVRLEKAATAPSLTPQQKEALVALSLHLQNGFDGEPLKEISRDEALEVVKAAFGAVSSKHRSTRAREAIDALIEAGRLMQNDSGMLSVVS